MVTYEYKRRNNHQWKTRESDIEMQFHGKKKRPKKNNPRIFTILINKKIQKKNKFNSVINQSN